MYRYVHSVHLTKRRLGSRFCCKSGAKSYPNSRDVVATRVISRADGGSIHKRTHTVSVVLAD